jgi:hypothetical protein
MNRLQTLASKPSTISMPPSPNAAATSFTIAKSSPPSPISNGGRNPNPELITRKSYDSR